MFSAKETLNKLKKNIQNKRNYLYFATDDGHPRHETTNALRLKGKWYPDVVLVGM